MKSLIESLEARIAPASIISSKSILYTDGDGDLVKLTFTTSAGLGIFDAASASVLNQVFQFTKADGSGSSSINGSTAVAEELMKIDLTKLNQVLADGANITLKVSSSTGDGVANLGIIVAGTPDPNFSRFSPYADLGKVYVDGDLHAVDAGDKYIDNAIGSLNVGSLGVKNWGSLGTAFNFTDSGIAQSDIFGPVHNVHIRGGVSSTFRVVGMEYGNIQNLEIDGTLTGEISFTGVMDVAKIGNITGGTIVGDNGDLGIGNIHSLTVLGSITGGSGSNSGLVFANRLGTVDVRGALVAGAGDTSGVIYAAKTASKIKVGSIVGYAGAELGTETDNFSSGAGAGTIRVADSIGSVRVFGNMLGGEGSNSGEIISSSLPKVRIDGSLYGGIISNSVSNTGSIVGGSVGKVTIGGDCFGGQIFADSTQLSSFLGVTYSGHQKIGSVRIHGDFGVQQGLGVVAANEKIGSVIVDGDTVGGCIISAGISIQKAVFHGDFAGNSSDRATIQAGGDAFNFGDDVVVGKVRIDGDMTYAQILAGVFRDQSGFDSHASIGTITVGGNFTNSNVSAGILAGADGSYGTADDSTVIDGLPQPPSKIASIIVKGNAQVVNAGGERFGIVAGIVGEASIGGVDFPLLPGASNDQFVVIPNVRILEVPNV